MTQLEPLKFKAQYCTRSWICNITDIKIYGKAVKTFKLDFLENHKVSILYTLFNKINLYQNKISSGLTYFELLKNLKKNTALKSGSTAPWKVNQSGTIWFYRPIPLGSKPSLPFIFFHLTRALSLSLFFHHAVSRNDLLKWVSHSSNEIGLYSLYFFHILHFFRILKRQKATKQQTNDHMKARRDEVKSDVPYYLV